MQRRRNASRPSSGCGVGICRTSPDEWRARQLAGKPLTAHTRISFVIASRQRPAAAAAAMAPVAAPQLLRRQQQDAAARVWRPDRRTSQSSQRRRSSAPSPLRLARCRPDPHRLLAKENNVAPQDGKQAKVKEQVAAVRRSMWWWWWRRRPEHRRGTGAISKEVIESALGGNRVRECLLQRAAAVQSRRRAIRRRRVAPHIEAWRFGGAVSPNSDN